MYKCEKKLHRGDRKDTFQKNKYAVCSMNMNNAIARHSWSTDHRANWEGSTVIGLDEHPQKKNIRRCKNTEQKINMNLDEGMTIHPIWKQFY